MLASVRVFVRVRGYACARARIDLFVRACERVGLRLCLSLCACLRPGVCVRVRVRACVVQGGSGASWLWEGEVVVTASFDNASGHEPVTNAELNQPYMRQSHCRSCQV